jgi:phosphoribosyl-ATP pyrophosphohydrolase
MSDAVIRLHRAAQACRHDDRSTSRTARLLRSGRSKIAKKFADEAVEVVIDAVHGDRDAIINDSADLIYNLVVLWISVDVHPEVVWKEIDRREQRLSISKKVPKKPPNRQGQFGD